jgi:hypothetical protein
MEDAKRAAGECNEDDLSMLDGWLRYQGIDAGAVSPEELEMWRDAFREVRERALATPKVGLMKLKTIPGEHRYAVAVRDGSDLWLTLWVRRSRKPEFFVMVPRGDSGWDPHTSYHNDGILRHQDSARLRAMCDRMGWQVVDGAVASAGEAPGTLSKSVGLPRPSEPHTAPAAPSGPTAERPKPARAQRRPQGLRRGGCVRHRSQGCKPRADNVAMSRCDRGALRRQGAPAQPGAGAGVQKKRLNPA